ncbi:SDR family NAD(P)-dependent oxidoreductase [Candidatus Woesearchaeota archaeon]|nr:SDR family NAD(P)-dependent oxidoreductase [Candidatus Woesearchaeota archaeon]
MFKNKKVLVTGGAGSIGSQIVKRLTLMNPDKIRVFDNDEAKQFQLQQDLKSHNNISFLIGDIRDKERLRRAMEGIDIVFHAAALKHVPFCEYNPFEAIKTNVVGTQNVVEAAMDKQIEKLIGISTDKAANPINTMGATKLLAEKLITDATFYKGKRKTIFACVRFGNVIGSVGSVVPLFREQISLKGPVTVTDNEMTRFVMSIRKAIDLVFKATALAKGGEIFIFKMPIFRIKDLAEVMIEELAPRYTDDINEVTIKNIGIRDGEKMHEDLMTENEASRAWETKDMFIVMPRTSIPNMTLKRHSYPGAQYPNSKEYCSRNAKMLSKDELRELLKTEKLI